MIKWIKNSSGATGTWIGQQLADLEYYQLQEQEKSKFASNSKVLLDVALGNLTIAKDNSGNTDLSDLNEAVDFLKKTKFL